MPSGQDAAGILARRITHRTTYPRYSGPGIARAFFLGSSGISGEGRSPQEEGPAIARVGGHRDTRRAARVGWKGRESSLQIACPEIPGRTFFLSTPVHQPTAHCQALSLLQLYTSEITLLLFPSPITLFPDAQQPLYTREPRYRHLLEKRNGARTLSLE